MTIFNKIICKKQHTKKKNDVQNHTPKLNSHLYGSASNWPMAMNVKAANIVSDLIPSVNFNSKPPIQINWHEFN